MKRLRFLAATGSLEDVKRYVAPPEARRPRLARLMGCSERVLQEWERQGASTIQAFAYVGLAYRIGGPARAQLVLEEIAQRPIQLEGLRTAARVRREQLELAGLTIDAAAD